MIPVSTNVFKSQDAAQRSKRSHWVGLYLSSSVFTANLWAFLPRITSLVNMLSFFSPPPRSLWDLSSLTRDQTQPQQGKHRILTTRPPGDSLGFSSFSSKYQSKTLCQGFKRRWRRGKLKFNLQTGLHYPLCVVWSMASFFKLKKLNIYSDSEILIHIYEIDKRIYRHIHIYIYSYKVKISAIYTYFFKRSFIRKSDDIVAITKLALEEQRLRAAHSRLGCIPLFCHSPHWSPKCIDGPVLISISSLAPVSNWICHPNLKWSF